MRLWFAVFFASIGLAAFSGERNGPTVTSPTQTPSAMASCGERPLSRLELLRCAAGSSARRLYCSDSVAAWIQSGAVALFVLYCGVVLFISRDFLIAVSYYLPATLFLLVVYGLVYQQGRESAVLIGLLGLVLTFVAAGIQQAQWSLHPVYLSYNALYHVVQAVALFFIYWSARWLTIVR